MITKIICIASAKGGSGKTSLTATIGTFLSKLGKKILLIDSDFGTNGLTLLYLKEVQVKAELVFSKSLRPSGLCEALAGHDAINIDLVNLDENLDLLPATFNLAVVDWFAENKMQARFQHLLGSLKGSYDFILIDAQAGADKMAQISMNRKISDEVVIVSEYDPMSAAGVERLKASLREDLTYDRTWILLNKILPEFVKSFSDFLSVAKYLSPIPWDAEVVRAYARRKLAINSDTGNDYTLSVIQTIKGLFGDTIQEELADWVKSRAAAIRQPIEQQYRDAEMEMTSVLRAQYDIEQKQNRRRSLEYAMVIVGISSASLGVWYVVKALMNGLSLSSSNFYNLTIILVIALPLIAFIMFALNMTTERSVKTRVDQNRLQRQLALLEDKLKRLELLRTLDPETLLKHRIDD